MTIELFPYKILIYYDIPELFVAIDKIKTKYICQRIPAEQYPKYLVSPISELNLNLILLGHIDIKKAFENNELGIWFYASFSNEEKLIAVQTEWQKVPNELLPDPDFFLQKPDESEEMILSEVNEKNNTILHLSLSDIPGLPSVRAELLADVLKSFQNLVKYSFKKEISTFKKSSREKLDSIFSYSLRAFASSPGSFNLHLVSTADPTLFGETNIDVALNRIDKLIKEYSVESDLIEILKNNKGHSVSSLKRLLELIIRDKLVFNYRWASPTDLLINIDFHGNLPGVYYE